MNSKAIPVICILALVVVTASTVCTVEPAQAVEPSSPAQTLQLSSPQTFSQEKFTVGDWKGIGIGGPDPAGSHTWDNRTLTITGAGEGLNFKEQDQCWFVHLTREDGDFEIVARLTDFTGEGNAAAGMMVRMDNTPNGSMAALFFKTKENTAAWNARIPGASPQAKPQMFSGEIPLAQRPPLWLRMVRLGKIQRGNDFPIGSGTTAKYKAAVKCYRTDGTFTGPQITNVVNPRALGYDAARDQLLVAENGPDLNVRFYGGSDTTPVLARTFGEKGGIYSGKKPGLQKYVSYNWNLRNFGEPVRASNSQSIVRRMGPDKHLVMFTTGQGVIGDINIYRYDGEIAIPAGGTRDRGNALWIDTNGDGKEDPNEITKMASPIGWITGLCVDSKGDLWAANSTTGGSFMRHCTFKGVNGKGVPIYSGVKGEGYEDLRFPEEGDKTSAWGMACRMDYDAERDIMVAFFPAMARKGEGDKSPAQYFMARYDNWSNGNRTSRWKVKAFRPETDPDYFMYEMKLDPYSGYMGMQIAGDYVFFAYLFGEVHVFDLKTGKLVEILALGPEVNGQSAWEDAAMGLRALKTRAGEYLIFTENSGWGGKNNFFRWRP